ncbi:glutaredoxin 3 [Tropicimonas sp. IMCC34011]|uniref:glutaredoxin 3 n=1 Tax=Tropicimonas sp. IMCC34011 TaxID=2248759 RepID=UPI000E24C2FE|nr:glutaredoxin 3 [Tropicimonas sp. IMCC34011]
MAIVEIYTTQTCGFCHAAKRLLKQKDVPFTEIDVTGDGEARERLMEKAGGRRTVPQIFIDGQGIGGFDELAGLEREGKLDPLLTA